MSAAAAATALLLASFCRSTLLDLLHDGRIGERRRIAELALLRDVAQEAPHDLAAACLGQLRREHDVRRLGDRADLGRDVVPQLLELLDRSLLATLQADV